MFKCNTTLSASTMYYSMRPSCPNKYSVGWIVKKIYQFFRFQKQIWFKGVYVVETLVYNSEHPEKSRENLCWFLRGRKLLNTGSQ